MRTSASVALLACLCGALAEEVADFSFADFFQGEWVVERSTVDINTNVHIYDETRGRYNMSKAGDHGMAGEYFAEDTVTGDVLSSLIVRIEFAHDPATGAFKTGAETDEPSEFATLFNFAFQHEPHNGMIISHGEYHGAKGGHYQFLIPSPDKWVLTVYQEAGEAVVYLGQKVVVQNEKSFFQRYGTMLMLGGFMLVNTFMQKKVRTPPAAATPPDAPTKATVEEITDEPKKDQ
mmetsp:Transcript_22024/g.24487  ORF Transcript_22024/g.24487 Transcript_22024/m.24487 type:complete len:234 (+) Transcript_22024:24-725(+)|eukprot:CAMPEP_0205832888 /NCGR_PEP_ID=MMETSP0206-20130828/48186_1 /ASSEMBLY_ACC=CAM_ASM_000279 /TAXON_ID=36767 /ORGANISM="Euplotes focardii, Strain TN1" /LENGTH=233 /DNA_ID=CAMNT_0053138811 /DNA_START=20 /DNA_END=721 /DNA_ORIENTATION=-